MRLVDPQAEPAVQALYRNLLARQGQGIMFGHQDALAYGVGWTGGNKRSDVHMVSGAYPAVFGWEISKLGLQSFNIDTVDFDDMRRWIRKGYQMGGIITISWHADNPVTGGSSWDNRPAVAEILPGGPRHDKLKEELRLVGEFMQSLKTGPFSQTHIPVVFRPWHEHSGGWFWWGRGHRKAEEYVQLWQFTVTYLRDTLGVHNLLYAYSPDVVNSRNDYLVDYPGAEFVDILGLDDYADFRPGGNPKKLTERLRMVGEIAADQGKPFALTETGSEAIPEPNFWTDHLIDNITRDSVAAKASWLLVWRNDRPDHHFAPYPGHPSAENFVEFRKRVLMVEDLPDLYR